MPVRLSRPVVALTLLLVTALAAAVALVDERNAKAQAATQTIVISNIDVLPSNGHVDLGPGTGKNDGTLGAACTGAAPRGGPNIPVGVVTELTEAACAQPGRPGDHGRGPRQLHGGASDRADRGQPDHQSVPRRLTHR